jgi:hypothetical protein
VGPFHLRPGAAVGAVAAAWRLHPAGVGPADILHPAAVAAAANPTYDDLLMPLAYAAGLAGDPISKLRTTHACIASA